MISRHDSHRVHRTSRSPRPRVRTEASGSPSGSTRTAPRRDDVRHRHDARLPARRRCRGWPGSDHRGPGREHVVHEHGSYGVGRITPEGDVTEFDKSAVRKHRRELQPDRRTGREYLVPETRRIDRVSPDGTLTRSIAASNETNTTLAAGPDGAIWFTEQGYGGQAGSARKDHDHGTGDAIHNWLPPGSAPSFIAAGPDGNLWFTDGGRPQRSGRSRQTGRSPSTRAGSSPTPPRTR